MLKVVCQNQQNFTNILLKVSLKVSPKPTKTDFNVFSFIAFGCLCAFLAFQVRKNPLSSSVNFIACKGVRLVLSFDPPNFITQTLCALGQRVLRPKFAHATFL
ncbi:hypothetical protein B0181_08955 [Moraxella caviae]|uniref:Uncharacterized protein n=1 Tax=Moraxella caviae TaxID=34060 RepID=A0A1S9ZX27_9GAMM|nr:hypothetical protein B0181_08955 [Moraxella caviae]